MRPISLPNPILTSILGVTIVLGALSCGRKGDPIPRPRARPQACEARWASLRVLEVRLPAQDVQGQDLVGLERVRVLYLPLGNVRPSALDLLARGEVIQERRRPDLPRPGQRLRIDLTGFGRPAGWLAVVAVRVGGVAGEPVGPLPWLDPRI